MVMQASTNIITIFVHLMWLLIWALSKILVLDSKAKTAPHTIQKPYKTSKICKPSKIFKKCLWWIRL